MLRNIVIIIFTLAILSGMQLCVSANPDTGDKKIYHNEKWDILLLYPGDWDYIEEFGDNIPVIMHPPVEEEADGFIMLFYAGENVAEDMEELVKFFTEDLLETYDAYEIISAEDTETREGFLARDLNYTFTDHDQEFLSNTRLIITDEEISWAVLFDRPVECLENINEEGFDIVDSIVFSGAEYLIKGEEEKDTSA